jgi:hypothetical protein
VAVSARKEKTMIPGSEWVVEFAVRERRARAESARAAWDEQQTVRDLASSTRRFRQQPLRRIHHLLMVAGTSLSRKAAAIPRVDTAGEEWEASRF